MSKTILSSLSISAVLSLTACGAATTEPSTSTTGTDQSGSSVPTISVLGSVQATDGLPLAGVNVCTIPGHSLSWSDFQCVTSRGDGSWQLSGLPAKGQVALAFEKQGYVATLRVFETGEVDLTLPADENRLVLSDGTTFLGVPADPNRGRVEFFVTVTDDSSPLPTSVALIGPDGKATAPIHGGDQTHGGFVDLESGEYMLVFQGAENCSADGRYGYPLFENPDMLPGAAALDVPVRTGYVTTPIRVECRKAETPVAR